MRRSILVFALLLVCAGCTKTVILQGYKRADTLLYVRTNNYFDLDGAQSSFVKGKLKEHLSWHRSEELPRVADLLVEIARRGKEKFGHEDALWMETQILGMRDRTLTRIEPDCSEFLTTLNEEQMVNFRAQFAKETSEIEEEFHANQDKKAALRAKRLVDFIEFWTGSLDSTQKSKAQEIARDLPDLTAMRLAYRSHGMAQVERLVREKAGKEKTREFLRSFWLLPGARPDPVAKQYSNESWKSFRTGTEKMDGILTKEQRKKAADKMIELAQDLRKISLESN